MKDLKTILKWIFGVVSIIFGLTGFSTSIIGGGLLLIAGAFLIPPFFDKINSNGKISRTLKIAIPIVAVFTGLMAVGISTSGEVNKAMQKIKEKKKEEYAKLTPGQKDSIAEIKRIKNELVQTSKVEKEQIIKKLKVKAKRDWPNDYTTQEYWINEQIKSYEYMSNIENNSIKRQAKRDWPLDFSTQKFWYNEQIEARDRLK